MNYTAELTAECCDHPELEGKIVTFVSSSWYNRKPCQVLITGCNFDIGCTLVDAKDHSKYFFCFHGLLSPRNKDGCNTPHDVLVNEFTRIIRQLRRGFLDVDSILELSSDIGFNTTPSADTCPFV